MLGSPGYPGRRGAKAVFIDGAGESAACGHGKGNERWELKCNWEELSYLTATDCGDRLLSSSNVLIRRR